MTTIRANHLLHPVYDQSSIVIARAWSSPSTQWNVNIHSTIPFERFRSDMWATPTLTLHRNKSMRIIFPSSLRYQHHQVWGKIIHSWGMRQSIRIPCYHDWYCDRTWISGVRHIVMMNVACFSSQTRTCVWQSVTHEAEKWRSARLPEDRHAIFDNVERQRNTWTCCLPCS